MLLENKPILCFVYFFCMLSCYQPKGSKQNDTLTTSDAMVSSIDSFKAIGARNSTRPCTSKYSGLTSDLNTEIIQPETKIYTKQELMGQFDPTLNPDFVPVKPPYTDKPGMLLRKEAYKKFEEMWRAAKSDGVQLKILSSTRNFDYQKGIWERKWKTFATKHPKPHERAHKILEFSSMPSTSRHHWGTDIDLNALDNDDFEEGKPYAAVYKWLTTNAGKFGFCQVYSRKDLGRPDGYNEEKWHWSYMPISSKMLKNYRDSVKVEDIKGFDGANEAMGLEVIRKYVFGINKECH